MSAAGQDPIGQDLDEYLAGPDPDFWSRVDKNGPPPDEIPEMGPCWLWTGGLTGAGYGCLRRNGQTTYAHRVAWILTNGPIPDGYQIDHLCRVRRCVRVSHLEPVTQRENILRGDSPAARQALQTHCIRGHEFTEANTYVRPRGGRVCRTCAAEAESRRQRPDRKGRR